jgi:hypothetical protein
MRRGAKTVCTDCNTVGAVTTPVATIAVSFKSSSWSIDAALVGV